jgi:cytochrome c
LALSAWGLGTWAPSTWAQATHAAAQQYAGIGRAATPAEIKAWDIDVRPDFQGLPPGSGSVKRGQQVWEAKCESCHGTFGESNEVFTPIAGGTTKQDIETGRVATLKRTDFPQRTTLMKLAQLSSLWDYVNRSMPWNAPKSLSSDEVYAVVAYILSLGDIVPSDFVLSDKNIAQVQARLPNRNGLVTYMPMWDVHGKGDVSNVACMKNCLPHGEDVKVTSSLPEHARNAHGNIAEQNRLVGAVRGADTTRPAPVALSSGRQLPAAVVAARPLTAPELANKSTCVACHATNRKLVGPSYADIAKKYAGDSAAPARLVDKVRKGGSGVWGVIPMPPHADMPEADLKMLIEWVLQGG